MKLPLLLSATLLAAALAAPCRADRPASMIWAGRCAGCHGVDGKGTPAGKKLHVPDLTDPAAQRHFTDAAAVNAIMTAREQGLHFLEPPVTSAEAAQLVDYVRSFEKKGN